MPSLRALSAEAIRKLDPSQIFGRYLALRPAGSSLKALCPFHPEKTPSFHINPSTKLWHCFGCGKGGNAVQFIEQIEKISYADAVRKLTDWAGIPFVVEEEAEEVRARSVLYEVLRLASAYYQRTLWETPRGKRVYDEFLAPRGIFPETAKTFEIGLSPDSPRAFTAMALERGFTPEALVASGLSVHKAGVLVDRLSGRLIFPIHSVSGEVIAFAGRTLSDSGAPKYLNTSDSPLFRKGEVLYNLGRARDFIRETGSVVLVEGYLDVIGLHQIGACNVVASMGTSLTPQQINRLRDFSDRIYIAFDSDSAGQAATHRSIEAFLDRKITPLIVQLPEGKDPDDIAREGGLNAWRDLLQSALHYPAFRLQYLIKTHDLSTPEGKDKVLSGFFETIARYDDPLYQKPYITQVADLVGLKPDTVQRRFRKFCASLRSQGTGVGGAEISRLRTPLTTGDYFIGFLLIYPELISPPLTELDPDTTFSDPVLQRIFRAMIRQESPNTLRLIEDLSDDSEASQRIATLLHSPLILGFAGSDPESAFSALSEALGITRLDYMVQDRVSYILDAGAGKDEAAENLRWLRSAVYEIVKRKLRLMGSLPAA
jgi:DNA primase catalytic core